MEWYWNVLVVVVAALVTFAATPYAIKIAKKYKVIDYPDGRRINTKPVPRLGGIAIFLGIVVAVGLCYLISILDPRIIALQGMTKGINYFGVAAAIGIIFGVGIVDDFLSIHPLLKLLGQIVAAVIVAVSGVLLNQFLNPFTGQIMTLGFIAYPITVIYLVAFANIINLIDGLDGLAAGIVAISAAALFLISFAKGGYDAAIFAAAIIGACLAFLHFNFNPAKIFMGDSGSLMLGFSLGVVSLFGVVRTPVLISLLIPVVIAGIPVIDTFFAIVRRLRAGKSIIQADKQHIHHRFIAFGFNQKTTVLIMYALSAVLAICAVIMIEFTGIIRVIISIVLVIIVILLVWRLGLTQSVLLHNQYKRARPPAEADNNKLGENDELE